MDGTNADLAGLGCGLLEALGLGGGGGVVSIVGGGGKSSLMFALGRLLPGRVVLTTTTRIFAAQTGLAPRWCSLEEAGWVEQIGASREPLLVVGKVEGDRAVGVPATLPGELLARSDVDWVVVEADGSRMLPVKAPAEHEPVVPDATGLLVVVAGIDALSAPIAEVAHRPEIVASITGLDASERLTPAALAGLLTSPRGGLKGAPQSARRAVFLNKVESRAERSLAEQVAESVMERGRVERVVSGALWRGLDSGFATWLARDDAGHV